MPSFELSHEQTEETDFLVSVTTEDLTNVDQIEQFGDQLREVIQQASKANQTHVALDFQEIQRVGSAGLNKLIEINSHARSGGHRLVLVDVQKTVRDVFSLTRLERLFEFASSPISA